MSRKSTEKKGERNIKEDTTIEMTLRLQGGMKNDDPTTLARDCWKKSSEPFSETSEIDEVKLSDVTAQMESASKRSDAKMDDMIQRMEAMHKSME